jgi:hypothetical protein
MTCEETGFADVLHLCQANAGLEIARGKPKGSARRADGAEAHRVQARSTVLWLVLSRVG